jgi:ABC-type proline/glycine betaine transport system permease subunit
VCSKGGVVGVEDVRRVLPPQAADEASIGLAGLGHGIVAGVEVLALLELVLQQVLLVGQLAVQPEQLLLLLRQCLRAFA